MITNARNPTGTLPKKWYRFYKDRVNSTYQDYFEERYKPMLEWIVRSNPLTVREEGIGIGSVSKALRKHKIESFGFDSCPYMVDLANINNGTRLANKDCIFQHKSTGVADLAVTHGVLEHFSDRMIKEIINRYKEEGIKSCHYVPTDKYTAPSFGDERLLSINKWLDLTSARMYIVFNEGHDLLLIV